MFPRFRRSAPLAILLIAAASLCAAAPTTQLLSTGPGGGAALAYAASTAPAVSADGRFVAFLSNATSFGGSGDGRQLVYLRDQQTGQVELVSRSSGGTVADGQCRSVAVSADTRFVLFSSEADNLVPGDGNHSLDVFLRDRAAGTTERIDETDTGQEIANGCGGSLALSADGRFVAFVAFDGGASDVFVRDRTLGSVERLSVTAAGGGDLFSTGELALSSDGRYVAFTAYDANLVPGDTNNAEDVFLRDRAAGTTERVSVGTNGVQAESRCGSPAVSSDGRYVAFSTDSRNLGPANGSSFGGVFVRDRVAGVTEAVSAVPNGDGTSYPAEHPSISGDGRYVTFSSSSQELAGTLSPVWSRIYLRDRSANTLKRVSDPPGGAADGDSRNPVIGRDGRWVVYQSTAGNLGPGDTNHQSDVFLHDAVSGAISRASVDGSGGQGTLPATSENAVVSADGGLAFFRSNAFNLVAGVNNNTTGIYLLRRNSGLVQRLDVPPAGGTANGDVPTEFDRSVGGPSISPDGRFVVFCSAASNLISGDTFGKLDVFLLDRNTGVMERESISASGQQVFGDSTCSSQAVSADGRYVAFTSEATNVVANDTNFAADDFVRDRVTGTVTRVNLTPGSQQADGRRFGTPQPPVISADGTTVAFNTPASNFFPPGGFTVRQIFMRDLVHGVTAPVSIGPNGAFGNGECQGQTISADGRFVCFTTGSSNLVLGDTNGAADGFVRDRLSGTTERMTLNSGGTELSRGGFLSSLSSDGRYALFGTFSPELTGTPITSSATLWLRDRVANTLEPVSTSGTGDLWHGGFACSPAAMSADLSLVLFDADTVPLPPGADYTFHGPARDVFLRMRGAPAAPPAPANLTATFLPSSREVRLDWSDLGPNETGFRIERADFPEGPFDLLRLTPANTSTFRDNALTSDRTYYYRVRATSDGGDSGWSNVAAVAVPPDPPGTPTLGPPTPGPGKIRLIWFGGVGQATEYRLERHTEGQPFAELARVGGDTFRYDDTAVTPNTTYTYRMLAANAGGASPYSNEQVVTAAPSAPAAPSGLTAQNVEDVTATLRWNDNSDNEARFRLEVRSGESWTMAGSFEANVTEFPLQFLQPGTRYTFRIIAVNTGGESAPSNEVTFTTKEPATGKLRVAKSLSFGTVRTGSFVDRQLVYRNLDRQHALRVEIFQVPAPFSIVGSSGSVLVPAGGTASVTLRFQPPAIGRVNQTLVLNTSQTRPAQVRVKLTGTSRR